jgi:dipeptidyl aminopeptidase/acylaminoacyl peptidase
MVAVGKNPGKQTVKLLTRASRIRGCLAIFMLSFASVASAQVDLDQYLRREQYGDIKISPTGEYYALTYWLPDHQVLLIMRRADKKITAKVEGGAYSEIGSFAWVNDERVVVGMAERLAGSRVAPWLTGELHAMNADGSKGKVIASNYGDEDQPPLGHVDFKEPNYRFTELIGTVPGDARHALVLVYSGTDDEPRTRVESVDVYTGASTSVVVAPVRRASFLLDPAGKVRFALGLDQRNASQLYYRTDEPGTWKLVNDENSSRRVEQPLGYAADGHTVYLQVEQPEGPDEVVAYDPATGTRKRVARDAVVDPTGVLYGVGDRNVVGVRFDGPTPSMKYFDPASPDAELHDLLQKSFPGDEVHVVSRTRDGSKSVLLVYGDRNPGDFYLFDAETGEAKGIFSRRLWVNPATAAPSKAVRITARDGQVLHGFLTMAASHPEGSLPLIVVPHGGPIGVYDSAGYDDESQLLAAAGYAVLRVNYRGSGHYGRKFLLAGEKQWGLAMQDDLTDATRWAIASKVADPARICLVGASYGAYAAMMGLAREPALYKCGVGYVGVYDLPLLTKTLSRRGRTERGWSEDWIGNAAGLASASPVNLAASIKAPVFLAAGGEDERAPIAHSRRLEQAIRAAGGQVETLYYPTEGHGFYLPAHDREYHVKLLDFLSRQLGGAKAK